MDKMNPWAIGAALGVTATLAYAVCALIFVLFPESSVSFLNSLFHGLDFRKLQPAGSEFSMGGFGVVALAMALWGFLVGALFASVRNLLWR